MKQIYFLTLTLFSLSLFSQEVWINELHYDNQSGDVNEGVEIAGTSGTDLSGWSVVLYNGSNGTVYDTINLSGVIPNESNNFGALWFANAGIQNGAPDGLALVNSDNAVIQFLSYEGTLTANGGPANGTMSTDIGVRETSSTPVGQSLQLTGMYATAASDFTWTGPAANSMGMLNAGQTFPTLSIATTSTQDFVIYPNPVTNGVVAIANTIASPIAVTVFNVLGKQVLQANITNTLDVSNLKAGLYVLQVSQNGNTTTKKLVIK